jgi:hypothetical protein
MRIPRIKGVIKRRILANFRADPQFTQRLLPSVFRPKLQGDYAIVGVCLIRLENIRPIGLPSALGISSENAAHRIAAIWRDEKGEENEGVYILRRDTSSLFNHLTGGRIFPGEHARATFDVHFEGNDLDFRMDSRDGQSNIRLVGTRSGVFPPDSCFKEISVASEFFKGGATGYSITKDPCRLDGLVLETKKWSVSALDVKHIESKFYSDEMRFPQGTLKFDNALLMENVEHEWRSTRDMRLP